MCCGVVVCLSVHMLASPMFHPEVVDIRSRSAATVVPAVYREKRERVFSRGGCRPAHSLPLHPGAPSNAWQRASPRGSEVTMLRRMQTATNLVPGMKVRPPPKRIATTSLILAQGATCSASSGRPREPAAAADASASATYCAGNWRPRSSLYHAHTHTRTHTCSLAR